MESMGTLATDRSTMRAIAGRPVGDLPACRLRRVTQYIQDNLHRTLRLAELSAHVHMSPYHFARLFKRSTGTPPHRFVLRRRIDRATTLLPKASPPWRRRLWRVGVREWLADSNFAASWPQRCSSAR
jgi:transcriptional regulator GlxA family with amidase domain